MLRSELEYTLPQDLIAQHPSKERSQSRLMVVNRSNRSVSHHIFHDLPDLLKPNDVVVLNNTKVKPVRLFSSRASSGGRVEIFLLEERGNGRWRAMTGSGGKLVEGEELLLSRNGHAAPVLRAELLEKHGDDTWEVGFKALLAGEAVELVVGELARMPLPPYIHREREKDAYADEDRHRYQTVYAAVEGAVAAPTAGLHFTDELFEALKAKEVHRAMLTLHVGPGTFKPVKTERVDEHPMHEETFEFPVASVNTIQAAQAQGGRVVAVGSTSTRVLESCVDELGELKAQRGATDLMILPGHQWQAVDVMITNFHLPHSTLLALVMAFADSELIRRAYAEAINERYRFFSYGDAMLIL